MTQNECLKTYFGYDSFRPGQKTVIDALLSNRDVLNVMPTGGGKSICYQIPALLLPGITLVISPLVSLMRDQVTQLVQSGVPAAFLNSSLTYRQYQLALERARAGHYKIIYVAPERLETQLFRDFALSAEISLLAVDEAHCISQWGQDFRPAYLSIPAFLSALHTRPAVGAFTATATPKVREDIERLLGLQDPLRQVTGFDRENLLFEVRQPERKRPALLRAVREHRDECGIVYCSTRKNVEEVCDLLKEEGLAATRYHAGLEAEERRRNQEDFLFGRTQVMVATNAFGMGIDKSDVRYVVHYNMPKDLESYYQEAGRAGRDGAPACCILLYSGQDVNTNQFLIEHSEPAGDLDPQTAAALRERDLERLKQMTYYCHSHGCLRQFILQYFGDRAPSYCGNCGNCLHHFEEQDIGPEAKQILRCVEQTGQHFGVTLIAAVLCGSDDERIQKYRLDEQSTYGSLPSFTQREIQERIRFLTDQEILSVSTGQYPILKLTAKAREIMGKDASLYMRTVQKAANLAPKPAFIKLNAEQADLLERLKTVRAALARSRGVPAFVIFSDKTLREMAGTQPDNRKKLMEVSGVGAYKAEQYGDAFLKAIVEFSC